MFKDFCRQTSLNGFGFLFSGDHARPPLVYTVVWSVVIAVTANWLFDLRGDDHDAFGQALVDNFDLFVGADR